MAKYIGNAFSLQMIGGADSATITVNKVDRPADLSDYVSVVGHPDTAAVLGVQFNRVNLSLQPGDVLLVAQLTGGRLPEGATTLPEGFAFKFYEVKIS